MSLMRRVDAGLLEQGGEEHPRPFRVGSKSVQRLRGDLQRRVGEHRRRVAAALDEMHARHHRVTRERVDCVDQRLLDEAMDDQLVLRRVDVGQARVTDREEQAVRRHRALQQVVRRARVRVAEFVVGIAAGAHHVFLEPRRHLVGRNHRAHFQAPRVVLQRRLGGGTGERDTARHGARHHGATA